MNKCEKEEEKRQRVEEGQHEKQELCFGFQVLQTERRITPGDALVHFGRFR